MTTSRDQRKLMELISEQLKCWQKTQLYQSLTYNVRAAVDNAVDILEQEIQETIR